MIPLLPSSYKPVDLRPSEALALFERPGVGVSVSMEALFFWSDPEPDSEIAIGVVAVACGWIVLISRVLEIFFQDGESLWLGIRYYHLNTKGTTINVRDTKT